MIFLIDPYGALLQGPDILGEDSDLDTAGAHAPGGRHDDDVTLHNSDLRDSLGTYRNKCEMSGFLQSSITGGLIQ